jgi:Uma2 family endonuclease
MPRGREAREEFMATATEPLVELEAADKPYAISSDDYFQMVEDGIIPRNRRVLLWDGRLYEKMAKTYAHFAVYNALARAIGVRLPLGHYLGYENPVRLDERHTPLPDLVVMTGDPLVFIDEKRYPDGRDVVLVAEVAVTSLPKDLGPRLARYALALLNASYLVVDVKNRRVLVHRKPQVEPAGYAEVETVGPGQVIRLTVGGVELKPIPFEDVMR